jgi:hypothetical protein
MAKPNILILTSLGNPLNQQSICNLLILHSTVHNAQKVLRAHILPTILGHGQVLKIHIITVVSTPQTLGRDAHQALEYIGSHIRKQRIKP